MMISSSGVRSSKRTCASAIASRSENEEEREKRLITSAGDAACGVAVAAGGVALTAVADEASEADDRGLTRSAAVVAGAVAESAGVLASLPSRGMSRVGAVS